MEEKKGKKRQVLAGMTMVVSGVFNEISRDKLEMMVSDYGARCTGSVSGKTDYLIIGYKLEDGREVTQGGKFKAATKKGTNIIDEQGFEKLMKKLLGDPDFTLGTTLPEMNVEMAKKSEKPKTPEQIE